MNNEIDQFLTLFPWKECRSYHNRSLDDETEDKSMDWKNIVLNAIPFDGEYLIKATYTDAVTLLSEYLLYCNDKKNYLPSTSPDYLLFVITKAKGQKGKISYHLLLSQVFLAYYHFFHHEDLLLNFLLAASEKAVASSDNIADELSKLFSKSFEALENAVIHPPSDSDLAKNESILNKVHPLVFISVCRLFLSGSYL
jgi:hypothetical protein